MNPLLQFDGIGKSFGGVPVLKDIRLVLEARHTLGLVGENGAGKSTLMNLLAGNLRPDTGRMILAGRPYDPEGPADAATAGIAFVHQELNLFPNLTIAENLFLTRFPTRGALWIRRDRLRAATADRLQEVGLNAAPDTPVERLSAGERQLVEIARALSFEPRLLILDEPTTSLSDRETSQLFGRLEALRSRGLAMIYISHTLEQVLRLSDDVAVLRDGDLVAHGPREGFDAPRLVALMVGRELKQLFPERQRSSVASQLGGASVRASHVAASSKVAPPQPRPTGKEPPRPTGNRLHSTGGPDAVEIGMPRTWPSAPQRMSSDAPTEALLEVHGVSQPGVLRNIHLTLHAGEVLGLFGLMGAGRSELARVLFGLEPCAEGVVRVAGVPLGRSAPVERIRRGMALLTEDRRDEGLALEAPIADNLALVTLRRHARSIFGWLNARTLRLEIARIRPAVRLTPTARDEAPARTLSGGNQQKVVLAKWLLAHPRILLLDEPTRGIDVGAKFEIYQLIHQLADDGAGVLIISSELEELLGLCDRLLVMRRGEIVAALPRPEFDRERILRAALHEGAMA